MTPTELQHLLDHLRSLSRETEWVEFKRNKAVPREIGEYLAALSNAAALHRQPHAYILWGVEDGTHNLVGTSFHPHHTKKGNEELEHWLLRLLDPRIEFRIHEGKVDGKQVVLFKIQPASHRPVRFSGTEYIRVGTYKKMTNSTLRRRLKIENHSIASRIIRDTIDADLIHQAGGSTRDANYAPFWA
ncbi:MAG: helix-turn-helix domain-containing protein [bacterium]